jgi:hypothetical protein
MNDSVSTLVDTVLRPCGCGLLSYNQMKPVASFGCSPCDMAYPDRNPDHVGFETN